MRHHQPLSLLFVASLLSTVSTVAGGWQSGRNLPTRAVESLIEIRPGTTVRIENPLGSLRVDIWSENRILWSAEKGGMGRASESSQVSLRRDGDRVTILVRSQPMSRLDLLVKVPQHARLELKTEAGAIELSGEPEALTAETTHGAITLKLPAHYGADLTLMTTMGTIQSELPVVVYGAFDAHVIRGRLGRGGAPVSVRTTSGTIRLVALPPALDQPSVIASADRVPLLPSAEPRVVTAPVLAKHPSEGRGERSIDEPLDRPEEAARDRRSPLRDDGAITLEAPLVNVNVSVTDPSGRAITDLTKEDFTIYEDGVPQAITHFSSVEAPFDLVLLLDTSGSTESKITVMKRAAQRFVDLIGPEDRMAVFTFTRRLWLIAPFTRQRFVLKESIERISGGGGTAFYEALWQTLDVLNQQSSRRRAIVVMTDGVDNSIGQPEWYPSRYTFEELLRRVEESDVIIYPIYLDTEEEMVHRKRRESPRSYAIARGQLAQLAEHTGGTLYRAATVHDLAGIYERVASELRTIYSLAYSPATAARDGRWHALRVEVRRPNAKIKSRRGYYAR
ncbi:MAG TPA: VWA domain-containing protein [Blastocatellia bacterium]|nr:VWA domain-containing protein [Blastocatellia bacterium]